MQVLFPTLKKLHLCTLQNLAMYRESENKAITEEDFVQWKAQLKQEMESLRENVQCRFFFWPAPVAFRRVTT